jgi:TolB-like protein/Tfp pilus assembly protein PilF
MNDWEKKPLLRNSEEGYRPVRLNIIGDFGLSDIDGRQFPITTKKNRALLAFLALSPGFQATRERLCGLLWGDRAEDQARSSLRQSLAVLRKELGQVEELVLKTHDDIVALRMETLQVDAVEFLALSNGSEITTLRQAAKLYRGELLNDTSIKDAAFEDWLSVERSRLRTVAIKIFDRLIPLEDGHSRIVAAQQLVSFNPLREPSHRLLMQAYADQGDNGLALKQFELCRKLLREELSVEPARETLELRRQILSGDRKIARSENSWAESSQAIRAEQLPSIAVLPFTNLSSDPEQQYFAEGISEDIITALTRFKSLGVIARNSTFRYRGIVDVTDAGHALDAKYVVVGSVRRIGTSLRISAQLSEASTARQIWAETFNAAEADLFKIQDELVQTIAGTLVGRVTDASVYHARLKPPTSLAAYELLLRANSLNWESLDAKSEARSLLEKAIRLDPEYATAYALLAAVGLREAAYHSSLTRKVLDIVVSHAHKAVEIDPNDSSCHSILGWVLMARRESDLAAEHISRALKLNPSNPFAMVNQGSLLLQVGKPDEAVSWFTQASRTDPYFNPWWVQEKLALAHFTARRYDLAASHFTRATKLRFHMGTVAAASLQRLGKSEAAKHALNQAFQIRPDLNIEIVNSLIPYSNPEDERHLRETLLAAGVPG